MQLSFYKNNKLNILLSLRQEYFDNIINGKKKYEYRFTFPRSCVRAYIYVPGKTKAIVGYMDLDYPIIGNQQQIAELYEKYDNGNYETMIEYIGNHKKMYAMKINKTVIFKTSIKYAEIKSKFPAFYAPQSYIILDKRPELLDYIIKNQ